MSNVKIFCGYAALAVAMLLAGGSLTSRLYGQTGCSKYGGCNYNSNQGVRDSTDCPGACYWKDCGLMCTGCSSYSCYNPGPCPCCVDECYGYGSCPNGDYGCL
jgi:hypothetical protein